MKRISVLILLVVLAVGSVWGEVVEIPDPNLRAALEKALGKNEGDVITLTDLASINSQLDLQNSNINDISGIQYCVNINNLNLNENEITDISLLSDLQNLTYLSISFNKGGNSFDFLDCLM